MIIKKFVANSEEEASTLMRQELGPEAVVLTKRLVRPTGLRALFSSDRVEITAGVDPEDLGRFQKERVQKGEQREGELTEFKKTVRTSSKEGDHFTLSREATQRLAREEPAATYTPTGRLAPGSRAPQEMDHQMRNLKKAGKGLVDHFRQEEASPRRGFQKLEVKGEESQDDPPPPPKEAKSPAPAPDMEEIRQLIRQEMQQAQKSVSVGPLTHNDEEMLGSVRFLLSKGVARSVALEIEEKMENRFGSTDMSKASAERTARINAVKADLASRIQTAGPIRLKKDEPTLVALIGPHGVGKTTTLAKLAVQYTRELKKRVAIITLDTTKRGAKDQILGLVNGFDIPVSSATGGFQMQQELGMFQERDLILIDTSGRNQYDRQSIDQIADLLSLVNGIQSYLVISAATKDLDVLGTIQEFAPIPVEGLIFSKMDETIAYGLLVNVCCHTQQPIAYVTNGVNVPGDLRLADGDEIARSLLVHHNNREFAALRKLVNQ